MSDRATWILHEQNVLKTLGRPGMEAPEVLLKKLTTWGEGEKMKGSERNFMTGITIEEIQKKISECLIGVPFEKRVV